MPQHHRGFTVLGAERITGVLCPCRYFEKFDRIAVDKSIRALRKQAVYRAYQVGLRTPVGVQVVTSYRWQPARLHVGKNIATAKAVNRLLGITNQGQTGFFTGVINVLENTVLNMVGILELVDHGDRILAPQACGNALSRIRLQCFQQQA